MARLCKEPTLYNTVVILGLSLGEVTAICVSPSILICEGLWGDFLLVVHRGWMVRGGGGGVGWGGMDHRGVVGHHMVGTMGHRGAHELRCSEGTTEGGEGCKDLREGWLKHG